VGKWGMAALDIKEAPALDEKKAAPKKYTNQVIAVIDRSLLVWLVAMALLTIGFWLG